jgi:TRAP-type C4-dicarboxylate transport system permease small subunit
MIKDMVKTIKKMKTYVAVILMATASLAPAMVPVAVYAQTTNSTQAPLCSGTELDASAIDGGGTPCATNGATSDKLTALIKLVINIISVVVGVVAVIMIVFGGLKYITSGGESSNVSSAKNTILYAIIGLVVVALAQFIVRFVLDKSITATQ